MSPASVQPLDASLVQRAHRQANAVRWELTVERFGLALAASVGHALADRPAKAQEPATAQEIDAYVMGLRLDELALATACADGQNAAWDHFVLEVRPVLYRAADALDPSGGARELADGLYADLFGLKETQGERQSLFRYFHGRSSLATWVRAVLSQRFVDRVRARKKSDELPDDDSSHALPAPTVAVEPDHERRRGLVQSCLVAAIARIDARDRLRLGCYYAQGLKLAAIGRLLGEHEATVSRHLARTRREIRDWVERALREDHGLTTAAIDECFAVAADDVGAFDVGRVLGQDAGPGRKEDELARSTDEGGRRVGRT